MAIEVIARILPRPVEDFDEMVEGIKDKHPGSGRNLKWTLIGLANHARVHGYCFPSVKRLERYTGLTRRSIQRSLKQGEVIGLLKRRKRTDMSNEYWLNLDMLPYYDEKEAAKEERDKMDFASFSEEPDLFNEPRATMARGGATDDDGGCHGDAPPAPHSALGGATLAPKTSVETKEETKEETVGNFAVAKSDDNIPLENFVEREWAKLKEDCPNIAACRKVDKNMVKQIRDRAAQQVTSGETFHDVWRKVFAEIRNSRFLRGDCPPGPGRTSRFKLSLGRLLRASFFREVINGTYANDARDPAFDPQTGELMGPARTAADSTVDRIIAAQERGERD